MQHIEIKVVFSINYSSFDGVVNLFTKHSTVSNSVPEEIRSRLRSGNACYYSVQIFYLLGCCPKI